MQIDHRELLIKHMLCCIDCEGTPCLIGWDDEDESDYGNRALGITADDFKELCAIAGEAQFRARAAKEPHE